MSAMTTFSTMCALWWLLGVLCSFSHQVATVAATSDRITDFSTSGVCLSVDIRTSPDGLKALEGCRVVEGSVQILLMDQYDKEDFENITFPLLVEITDYLMLYRINGVRSLYQLFPNLAVIRGQRLFKNYALVIYEMLMLEEIGLTSLTFIERGSVRIEKNDYLCGADKIDWTLICNNTSNDEHYIAQNKGKEYCPICPVHCPTAKQQTKKLCWNMIGTCQRDCSAGTCCSPTCAACEVNNPNNCTVCRHLSLGNFAERKCVDKCPPNTYQHAKRRCITEEECRNLNNDRNITQTLESRSQNYVPFQGHCHLGCPQGFVEKMNSVAIECVKCDGACLKHCPAKSIDSISAAQSLAGCAVIDGSLEIQIRSQGGRGTNIIRELEQSLSSIEEITGYLKIARSFPIVSLSFLKNLKRIRGMVLDSKKYSLVVMDNQNLQELWEHQVVIERGKLSFHYNPKLCFFKIEQLDQSHQSGKDVVIDNIETSRLSNGDKTACNVTVLNVTVNFVLTNAALLEWDPLVIDDERSLLGYVVSYIAAPYDNVTLYDGRDACGTDGWHVDDVTDFVSFSRVSFPLTRLEPYTQYAFYVKTYTISTEKRGAQSPIKYFTTAPGKPEKVRKYKAVANSSSEIIVSWERPRKANGKLTHYVIKARLIEAYYNIIEQRNYCEEPLMKHADDHVMAGAKHDQLEPSIEPPKEKCDCDVCTSPKKIADLTDAESAIDFENDLQDYVYIRYNVAGDPAARNRRHLQDDHEHEGSLVSTKYKRNEPTSKPDSEEQLFPEPAHSTAILPHDQQRPRIEVTQSRKHEDYYEYVYQVVEATNATGQQQFVLRDLRHFATYAISVRACREGRDPDNCSSEQSHSEKTKEKKGVDNISKYNAQLEPSNSTLGSIKVSWMSPQAPNGFIVSYTIKWQRVDIEHSTPTKICITHKHYQMYNGSYQIPNLATGNYSIEVMATSIAGDGQYTPKKYLYIEETRSYAHLYIIGGLMALLILLITLFIWKCRKLYMPNISNMKLIAQVNPDYAGVQYKVDDWEVARDRICQYQELGQGSFGMVYSGTIRRDVEETPCAIKTVNENATDKERASFLNEASVMKQFDTHHVVRLLGVVSKGQPTLVIMELMANGDLKGYLRSHRADYDAGTEPMPQPPTLRRILQIAAEIADGMAYLSAKKFVHRDLAARNCMVAEDLTVKIGDFGMTRDIYETDYYRKGTKGLLPVRWMSPESLKDGVFTSHSDVFSYGVVLWEMATLASQPYQGLSNDQVLRYVIDGGVMERPENCPDRMYEMMRRCWQHRPSARPSFLEIISLLLNEVEPSFKTVSFYHTPEAQDLYNAMKANHVMDDVTTPLRRGDDLDDDLDDEDNSSLDGHYNSMEGATSDHLDHHLVPDQAVRPHMRPAQH